MGTVIIAIIVFGLVGLAVWAIIRSHVRHTGSLGCSCGMDCCGDCAACGAPCEKAEENTEK